MDEHVPEESQEDLLDLNEVMQAFGVGEWKNLGAVSSSQAGLLSLLVDIEGQQYILRERAEGPAEEDIHHRYRFQEFLQQAGIPVPAFRRTPQGEPMVTVGEEYFELQHMPEGEEFSTSDLLSLDWTVAAGRMLGQIHQASQRYTGPIYRWPPEAHIGGVVQGYLNLAHSKAESSSLEAVRAALENMCEQWEAILPAAMVAIGAVKGLPEFHIHGDYHALNLRFERKDVSAVLNWEASRWEKRIIELAYALFYFSALDWSREGTTRPIVKRGLSPERATRFLEGYGSICAPVQHEATILGDALAVVAPVAIINGPLEDVFFSQDGVDEAVIDDVMERITWAASFPAWLGKVRRSLGDMWR